MALSTYSSSSHDYYNYTGSSNVATGLNFEISNQVKEATEAIYKLSKELKEFEIKEATKLEIEKIKTPLPDEVVVLKFDFTKINIDEAQAIFSDIKKAFPYNQVLGIPQCCDVSFSPPEVI